MSTNTTARKPAQPGAGQRAGRLAAAALLALAVSVPATLPFLAAVPPAEASLFGGTSQSAAAKAVATAFAGRYADAAQMAQQSGDPVAVKLVEWAYLRDQWKAAGYDRIMAFVNANPGWPQIETLRRRAEQSLLIGNESPDQIAAHFAGGRSPVTAEGMLALARAAMARGDAQRARARVSEAWRAAGPDAGFEQRLYQEFGKYLSAEDHRARFAHMVFDQEPEAAARAAARISPDYKKAAQAVAALLDNKSNAEKAYKALPAAVRSGPAMQYVYARWLRKNDRDADAAGILINLPNDARVADPEQLWIERRIVARDLLGPASKAQWRNAYRLAAQHGLTSGPYAAEGEFLAGWIALRFLDDPKTALKHFGKLNQYVTSRFDMARAAYWTGRSYAQLGDGGKAQSNYLQAAAFPTVFYGQLARDALGQDAAPIPVETITPSSATKAKVARDDLVRAFQLMNDAGRSAELLMFLAPLANRFSTAEELSAVAAVVWDAGGPYFAVKLSKAASARGLDIDYWGYPLKALPDWKPIGPKVERSLVFGLARQESEFNPTAGSRVGAQGLMQLMPGTAKLIAKQYKVAYKPEQLTGNPTYNVTLGAAHLGDLVNEFGGSYVLALAAYNAGPRRAAQWVERYGDPRGAKVDPIDWVESVPFDETRSYIQKVLQNTQVYRSRLDPGTMQGMLTDLERGQPGSVAVANADADASSGTCGAGADSLSALLRGCQ